MSKSGAISVTYVNQILDRIPGEAGRSLVRAYFEAEHPRTSILHPQGQCAGMPSSGLFRSPVKPRQAPAPHTTTPPHGRYFRDGSYAGTVSGPRPTRRGGRWGRHGTEMNPPPPSSNPTEFNRSSATQDSHSFRKPNPQAGASQDMTPFHRPNPLYGPAEENVYSPFSNIDYAASAYSSPAPFQRSGF